MNPITMQLVADKYIRLALEAVSYTHLDVYKRQSYDRLDYDLMGKQAFKEKLMRNET